MSLLLTGYFVHAPKIRIDFGGILGVHVAQVSLIDRFQLLSIRVGENKCCLVQIWRQVLSILVHAIVFGILLWVVRARRQVVQNLVTLGLVAFVQQRALLESLLRPKVSLGKLVC